MIWVGSSMSPCSRLLLEINCATTGRKLNKYLTGLLRRACMDLRWNIWEVGYKDLQGGPTDFIKNFVRH